MSGFIPIGSSTDPITVTAKDYYNNYYQQAKVALWVNSSGKLSWKLTMTNDNGGSRGRAVRVRIVISGKEELDTGYVSYGNDSTNKAWGTFPTGNGTTESGSRTYEKAGDITIKVSVCCMQNDLDAGDTATKTITLKKWSDISAGTVTITDNKNNTFTIKATKGSGTNNPTTLDTLRWGYTDSYANSYKSGDTIDLAISGTSTSRTVYAKARTVATYGKDKVATTNKGIKQYFYPNDPGRPVISYSKSKLTLKENWKYSWSKATTPNSTTSPVKGYRIRVYKNGTAITGLTASKSNDVVTVKKGSGTANYIDYNTTSITFDPVALGFEVGDTVSVGVYAYTIWGDDSKKFNNKGVLVENKTVSVKTTVENAGIVHVRVDGVWKEGQAYVRVAGSWKEAESVLVRDGEVWKEAT